MALGIHGYVFKDDAVNDLVSAIKAINEGKNYISVDAAKKSFFTKDTHELIGDLTKMERVILREIALQKTTKQIADEHFISTKTVENHRANICKKLNLTGNNSLLKFALKVGELMPTLWVSTSYIYLSYHKGFEKEFAKTQAKIYIFIQVKSFLIINPTKILLFGQIPQKGFLKKA